MTTKNGGPLLPVSHLAVPLLDASIAAAIACREWVGRGDKHSADAAAVDAMRGVLQRTSCRGVVVIGEGEKDAAPMLFTGEVVGSGVGPMIDIAVDPLEGTNLCATGAGGAVTVISAAGSGCIRPLAGYYMDKIVVGPQARGEIDIDAPIELNLMRVAAAKGVAVTELKVAALRRPRNEEEIGRIRGIGASVTEISDGDVMTGLEALLPNGQFDLSVGIGGAPEGVITACAARLCGGDMQGRLTPQSDEERAMVDAAGETGLIFGAADLVSSEDAVFVASGVTGSASLSGVRPGLHGLDVYSVLITPSGVIRTVSSVDAADCAA